MSSVLLGGAEGEERFGASVAVLPMTLFPLELILFRIDWFGFPAVQGCQESSPQFEHHNLKASVLWCAAFFMNHKEEKVTNAGSENCI